MHEILQLKDISCQTGYKITCCFKEKHLKYKPTKRLKIKKRKEKAMPHQH